MKPNRKQHMKKSDIDQARKLFLSGMRVQAIAHKFGVTKSVVEEWLRQR